MVGGEPGGADGLAFGVAGDHVMAQRVQRIPFEVARNALFFDEYDVADPAEIVLCCGVVDRLDAIAGRAHDCVSPMPGSSSSRASW